jgi:hypothetical protein
VDDTPFWVECKTGKSPSIWKAFIQAAGDSSKAEDERPLLVYLKKDRTPPIVAMLANEFVAYLAQLFELIESLKGEADNE